MADNLWPSVLQADLLDAIPNLSGLPHIQRCPIPLPGLLPHEPIIGKLQPTDSFKALPTEFKLQIVFDCCDDFIDIPIPVHGRVTTGGQPRALLWAFRHKDLHGGLFIPRISDLYLARLQDEGELFLDVCPSLKGLLTRGRGKVDKWPMTGPGQCLSDPHDDLVKHLSARIDSQARSYSPGLTNKLPCFAPCGTDCRHPRGNIFVSVLLLHFFR